MEGPWVDLLLIAVLAAAGLALYRLLPAGGAPPVAVAGAGPAGGGELAPRLRGFYLRLVRQAGLAPERWLWALWLAKLALAALAPLAALELLPAWWPWARWPWLLVAALAGFFLPDVLLHSARRARRQKIAVGLTHFLDLLTSLLRSGVDLRQAFRRAGREGFPPSHPLAREVALVSAELEAGREPGDAFRALAERTGVREMRGIAASLELSRRFGASARTTLETQAEMLWTRRRENALRRINAGLVKSIFPVFLCGVPLFVVLVLFPILLEFSDLLTELLGFWE